MKYPILDEPPGEQSDPDEVQYHHETVCREKELKAEVDRLRDIIRRASAVYAGDGGKMRVDAAMFYILSESIDSK